MRNINFLPRFADAVQMGKKRQTIRKRGKQAPPTVGDALMLFTGLRTSSSRRLRAATATSVESITITCSTRQVFIARPSNGQLAYFALAAEEIEQLAREDGFYNADEFFRFFHDVHDGGLCGYLLKWD